MYIKNINNPNLIVFSTIINANVVLSILRYFLKFKLVIREATNPKLFIKKNFVIKFYYFLAKIFYKKSDLVISNSVDKINLIEKYYNIKQKSKIFFLPNPIKKHSSSIKNLYKFKLNRNDFNIVCLGRFSESKSYEDAINAIHYLNLKNNNISLHMIGPITDKNYYEYLLQTVEKLNLTDKIFFHPKTNDVINVLKRFDLFLLTSKYEGFPNTILDAVVANIPILSSNCDFGPREIVEKYNVGLLYEINDKHGIINGITRIMKKEVSFDQNGYYKIISKFNIEQVYKIFHKKIVEL